MLIFNNLNNSRKLIIILDLLKIIFIVFIAFSFLIQMSPYFFGNDSYFYGNSAIALANGKWGISNELLKETGLWEFVPWVYTKTIHNEAIPFGASIGMYGLSTLAYLIGGHYGLFYLAPIFSILLILALDRICVKLFGRFVAFFVVILTGTNWVIFEYGVQLYSESIFTFFLIIGVFFLIKFIRKKDETLILLSSTFLVASAFIKSAGMIFFPFEIFLVFGFLLLPIISKGHNNTNSKTISKGIYTYYKKNQKKIFKIIFFMLIPWLIFFLVNAVYNSYYFGDPSASHYTIRPISGLEWDIKSAFDNISLDFFQWIEINAALLLPDKLLSIFPVEIEYVYEIGPGSDNTWIGIISILIIFSAIIVSFLTKNKRMESITIGLFIFAIIAFYSMATMIRIPILEEYGPMSLNYNHFNAIRYLSPVLPLFYMLFGFILFNIIRINTDTIQKINFKTLTKFLKFGFLTLVILFLAMSFYDSNSVQGLIKDGKHQGHPEFTSAKKGEFVNPQQVLKNHFPLDLEGLPEKSVIVGADHYITVEHGKTPFFPYWGFNFFRINLEPDSIPQEPIETLKQLLGDNESYTTTGAKSILNDGYSVFVLKEHWWFDTSYYNYLKLNHGIILQDYSKSFCKMELVDELNFSDPEFKPDEICY